MKLLNLSLCSTSVIGLVCAGVPALAAAASSSPATGASPGTYEGGIADIVVTAQRRASSAQDTPIALTAVTGEALRDQNVTDIISLSSSIPNVQFSQSQINARLSIRGVGFNTNFPGAEARVAYYVDDVYVSRPGGVLGTFFDVDRVEVLRGPQGTLYGRNATAGAINVITKKPTDILTGFAQVTFGNYQYLQLEGGIGGPLAEGISYRISGATTYQFKGYGKNELDGKDVNDQNTEAVRGQLQLEPADTITLNLESSYTRQNDRQGFPYFFSENPESPKINPAVSLLGGQYAKNRRDVNYDQSPNLQRTLFNVSGTLNWDIGDRTTLTTIGAYRYVSSENNVDQDMTQVRAGEAVFLDKSRQYSFEARVNHDFDWGNLVVGGYYFKENIYGNVRVEPIDLGLLTGNSFLIQGFEVAGDINTRAIAGFAQVHVDLSDTLSVDVGARYGDEKKEKFDEYYQFSTAPFNRDAAPIISNFIPYDKVASKDFTPKVTLNYQPNSDTLLYATFSQAVKLGGFNLGGLQPPFDTEKLTDYEVGAKLDLLDGRLRANFAAFYYKYDNIQVYRVKETSTAIENAASSDLYGIEAEIVYMPTADLKLDLNVGWLHSEYKDYITKDEFTGEDLDLSGNKLQQAPDYTVNAGVEYMFPMADGDLVLRGEGQFMGRTYFYPKQLDFLSQKPYETFNAFVTYRANNGLAVSAYVKNIADKFYITAMSNVSTSLYGGALTATYGAPRTYGLKVGYSF